MRANSYSYREVVASPKRQREEEDDDLLLLGEAARGVASSSSSSSDEEEEEAAAGSSLYTFAPQLGKYSQCVFVHVDPHFLTSGKRPQPNAIAEELRSHAKLYLHENSRFRMLLKNSVLALGERVEELRGAPAAEAESLLHRWILEPILARGGAPRLIMGNSATYPWTTKPQAAPGAASNSATDAGPTFFAGWATAPNCPVVAFLSDWYDAITSQTAFQRALLAIGKCAADSLLADPRFGSYAAPPHANPLRPPTPTDPTLPALFGLPRFACFLICTRHFAQFGAVHKHGAAPSQLTMIPLSRRLEWDSRKDRRHMLTLSLGLSCWLKRCAT